MYVSMSIDQSFEGSDAASTTVTIETLRGMNPETLIEYTADVLRETIALADAYAAEQSIHADVNKNDEPNFEGGVEPAGLGV